MFDLYAITADAPPERILDAARAVVPHAPPGRVALQLRAPQLPTGLLGPLARSLRALTRQHGVLLLLSAAPELAREIGADGVQLPERGPSVEQARAWLGPGALIGASRHDLAGVRAAELAGASFATLGPVFETPGKAAPLGLSGFGAVARACRLPLYALGGIDAASAPQVLAAGARGIAVIRALWDDSDPERALHRLLAALDARGATA